MNLIPVKISSTEYPPVAGQLFWDADTNSLVIYQDGTYYNLSNFTTDFEKISNLLYPYASLKLDNNGDGLGDGWYVTAGATKIIQDNDGKNAQYVNYSGSSITMYVKISNPIDTVPNNTYFSKIKYRIYQLSGEGEGFITQFGPTQYSMVETQYPEENYAFTSATIPSYATNTYQIMLKLYSCTSLEVYLSQPIIVNLTKMGDLPPLLKFFFSPSGITSWEDLATSSNITAVNNTIKQGNAWLLDLIPYTDHKAVIAYSLLNDKLITNILKEGD